MSSDLQVNSSDILLKESLAITFSDVKIKGIMFPSLFIADVVEFLCTRCKYQPNMWELKGKRHAKSH